MKKHLLALACASVVATPTIALAELSANIGVTSNYIWRGLTQTDNKPAIQGGVDYAHESGFYLGTWASNVDFDSASTELDLYAGFAGEAGVIGYDVGVIRYIYPGTDDDDDFDFTELYASIGYEFFEAGIAYDPSNKNTYFYGSASVDVAEDWSLGLTVGRYNFDEGDDYTHGLLELTKSAGDFGDFTLGVSKASSGGDLELDTDPLVFVAWTKSF